MVIKFWLPAMRISNSIWPIFWMFNLIPVCSYLSTVLFTGPCCGKISKIRTIRKTEYFVWASQASVFSSLKWDSWTRLWFLTTGGHENHLWNLNKILSLDPSSENSDSICLKWIKGSTGDTRTHSWLKTTGLDFFQVFRKIILF